MTRPTDPQGNGAHGSTTKRRATPRTKMRAQQVGFESPATDAARGTYPPADTNGGGRPMIRNVPRHEPARQL